MGVQMVRLNREGNPQEFALANLAYGRRNSPLEYLYFDGCQRCLSLYKPGELNMKQWLEVQQRWGFTNSFRTDVGTLDVLCLFVEEDQSRVFIILSYEIGDTYLTFVELITQNVATVLSAGQASLRLPKQFDKCFTLATCLDSSSDNTQASCIPVQNS